MSKKTLCDWKKEDIDRDFKKLSKIVLNPKYICNKCVRVANKEDYLCKPKKL